jgi:hypothetical protein
MKQSSLNKEDVIKSLVATAVEAYAEGFQLRHENEVDNPNGVLNMKIHNVFIAALESIFEKLAIQIAKISYHVEKKVEGSLGQEQTAKIAALLEKYKRREINPPTIEDYQFLRVKPQENNSSSKRHESDYYLVDKETKENFLIELKIGGDLDNKKLNLFFATAYNRYDEDKPWKQERARQFFVDDELLAGRDFWNFICKTNDGYKIVMESYKETLQTLFSIN